MRIAKVASLVALGLIAGAAFSSTGLGAAPLAPPPSYASTLKLKSDLLFNIVVDVQTYPLGETARGLAIFDRITGGRFQGNGLSGVVLPTGSGFAHQRGDGSFETDVDLLLQTSDQVLIRMKYRYLFSASDEVLGRIFTGQPVDPGEYYFRSSVQFDAPLDSPYAHLNTTIAVGVGQTLPGSSSVQYSVYAVQ